MGGPGMKAEIKLTRDQVISLMAQHLSEKLGKTVTVTGFRYWPSSQRDPASWFDISVEIREGENHGENRTG